MTVQLPVSIHQWMSGMLKLPYMDIVYVTYICKTLYIMPVTRLRWNIQTNTKIGIEKLVEQ